MCSVCATQLVHIANHHAHALCLLLWHNVFGAGYSKTQKDPLAFLRQEELFGSLADKERFSAKYVALVEELYVNPDVSVLMRELRKQM